MSKKIIVAGAGHGGLGAAAMLAKSGLDVTVYEKKEQNKLGYDWKDAFYIDAFTAIGMKLPPEELYGIGSLMTFYGPSCKTALKEKSDPKGRTIKNTPVKMERKVIYKLLIDYCLECGVKFVFNCEITGVVIDKDRVIGIKTASGEVYADLVIDAAGIDSPVRTNLPSFMGIQNEATSNDRITIYRAYYNKEDFPVEDPYKVLLLYNNENGISWVCDEGNLVDVLIGKFTTTDEQSIFNLIGKIRNDNPYIGEKLVRGGEFVPIPVTHPLSRMVHNGYAAIGDSAFMTVPVIGSGIANSLYAAKILAQTVLEDADGEYSSKTLWNYQYKYFKEIGFGMAKLAFVKIFLTKVQPEDLTFFLDNDYLTPDMLSMFMGYSGIGGVIKSSTMSDYIKIVKGLNEKREFTGAFAAIPAGMAKLVAVERTFPKSFDEDKLSSWCRMFDNLYR